MDYENIRNSIIDATLENREYISFPAPEGLNTAFPSNGVWGTSCPIQLSVDDFWQSQNEQEQALSETLGSEIESGEINPADIDYEARKQIMDYYQRSGDDQDGKEYLVRGAQLRCSCGSNSRKLNLSPCHGVYFKAHPLAHQMDCKQGETDEDNITWFGICDKDDLDTKKIVVVDDNGKNQTGLMCKPEIIGNWKNTYNKAQIAGNHVPGEEYELYDALTMDSYLICRHGGIITPVDSGQEREVTPDEFREGQEAFDRVMAFQNKNSANNETVSGAAATANDNIVEQYLQ